MSELAFRPFVLSRAPCGRCRRSASLGPVGLVINALSQNEVYAGALKATARFMCQRHSYFTLRRRSMRESMREDLRAEIQRKIAESFEKARGHSPRHRGESAKRNVWQGRRNTPTCCIARP